MRKRTNKKSDKLQHVLPPVRCSIEDKKSIRLKADQCDLSMSEYIRNMALNGKIIIRQNSVDFETVHQLKKIGININQQTKALHATGTIPYELKALWKKLDVLLELIMKKQ